MHRRTPRAPKTSALHWAAKVRKPAKSNLYGVQIAYRGRRHRFPLETANKEAAAEKARDIFLSLVAVGWEQTILRFNPKNAPSPVKSATVGGWLAAVEKTAGLRKSTFTTYAQSLRQIAAEIADIGDQPALDANGEPKRDRKRRVILMSRFDYKQGGRAAWAAKVDALPLTELSAGAVQRWKLGYIERAGLAPDARRRAENSAASLIRSARALFSAKCRRFAETEQMLPEPLPFANVELPRRGSTAYQSKIDAKALIAAARQELSGDPFKIFVLGLFCGLRKREIDLLSWPQIDLDRAVLRIERTEYFRPKSEDSVGEVDLDPQTVDLLKRWKAEGKGPFVVQSLRPARHETSRTNYRCTQHFEALYAWLRSKGVSARKPLHELRKELGALLASEHGIFAAQRVLRHAHIATTAAYYTDKKKRITAGLGELLNSPDQRPASKKHDEEETI